VVLRHRHAAALRRWRRRSEARSAAEVRDACWWQTAGGCNLRHAQSVLAPVRVRGALGRWRRWQHVWRREKCLAATLVFCRATSRACLPLAQRLALRGAVQRWRRLVPVRAPPEAAKLGEWRKEAARAALTCGFKQVTRPSLLSHHALSITLTPHCYPLPIATPCP
jgi:hypothetical protein